MCFGLLQSYYFFKICVNEIHIPLGLMKQNHGGNNGFFLFGSTGMLQDRGG